MEQSIETVAFFKGIAGLDIKNLSRQCRWQRHEGGETIIDFEDPSSDIYFVQTGEVRILIRNAAGREMILAEMQAGQVFGEMSAIDGVPRSANVTALTRTDLCIMPAAVLRELIFSSPAVCDRILRLLTGRMRSMNVRLTEHSMLDLKHRLIAELLRLSHPRANHPGERMISPPPFHHDLSARIGCRREQVSRELSVLVHDGSLEKTRGALVLKKPQALQERLDAAMQTDD